MHNSFSAFWLAVSTEQGLPSKPKFKVPMFNSPPLGLCGGKQAVFKCSSFPSALFNLAALTPCSVHEALMMLHHEEYILHAVPFLVNKPTNSLPFLLICISLTAGLNTISRWTFPVISGIARTSLAPVNSNRERFFRGFSGQKRLAITGGSF